MKSFSEYIYEALKIKSGAKIGKTAYTPKSMEDLRGYIKECLKKMPAGDTVLDISNIDCSEMSSLKWIFEKSHKENFMLPEHIKTLKVYNWKVDNISNFDYMFHHCHHLEHIEGLHTWNMRNAKSLNECFSNCDRLKELDLTGWEHIVFGSDESTTHPKAVGIFSQCINLTKIKGIEFWDFSNVTSIEKIFFNCNKLVDIDVTKWKMPQTNYIDTGIRFLFCRCYSLKSLDLSKWDVSQIRDFTAVFRGCSELTDIGNLTNWNFSNLFDMEGAFESCSKLQCDLSHITIPISCVKTNAFKYTSSKIFKKPKFV